MSKSTFEDFKHFMGNESKSKYHQIDKAIIVM